MTTLNPYLVFNGNCEAAFNFYRSVFGGDFQYIGRYKDVPQTDRQTFSANDDQQIMHVSLPISKETVLMGCDGAEAPGEPTASMNNFFLSVTTDRKKEADRLFHELSTGGKIKMPMAQTFWGSYFGALEDKFGIHWTVSYDLTLEK